MTTKEKPLFSSEILRRKEAEVKRLLTAAQRRWPTPPKPTKTKPAPLVCQAPPYEFVRDRRTGLERVLIVRSGVCGARAPHKKPGEALYTSPWGPVCGRHRDAGTDERVMAQVELVEQAKRENAARPTPRPLRQRTKKPERDCMRDGCLTSAWKGGETCWAHSQACKEMLKRNAETRGSTGRKHYDDVCAPNDHMEMVRRAIAGMRKTGLAGGDPE